MKIKRMNPRKRLNTLALACGCLVGIGVMGAGLIAIAAMLIIPALPNIALQSAGFEHVGDTDAVFAEATAQPPPILEAVQSPPETVVIQAGNVGPQTIENVDTYDIQVGTINGQSTLQMTFNESDLLALCQQYSEACRANGNRIRNVRFDLRTGGMVVYGDVLIEQLNVWQNIGVVMRLTSDNRLAVSGVDVNGQLYAAPPNEIGNTIAEIETIANDVLRQLTVQAGGENFILDSIYMDDSVLVLTMR
jgi:hypothetical protein